MKPKLMAHRGLPWSVPENTLASFKAALDWKCEILEFDVRMSPDKVLYIMHDDTVDRTTDSTGSVETLTWAELSKMQVTFTKTGPAPGEPIPTLEQTIDLLVTYPDVVINLELKDYREECIARTLEMIKSKGILHRTYFTCFHYPVLRRLKELDPTVKVQGFPLQMMKEVPDDPDAELLFDYVGIKADLATPEMLERYRELSMTTGIWTVNDEQGYARGRELGIEIITTDRIDWMTQLQNSGP
jgi:glycerophosphoryl diester phosphodiesterase